LRIHFEALRQRGRLSLPLCCAIEGIASNGEVTQNDSGTGSPVTSPEKKSIRTAIKRVTKRLIPIAVRPAYDLAGAPTAGFSGADIAGLVRCAGSLALSRVRRDGNSVEHLLLTLEDAKQALKEIKER